MLLLEYFGKKFPLIHLYTTPQFWTKDMDQIMMLLKNILCSHSS
jgi:hypothetical protein